MKNQTVKIIISSALFSVAFVLLPSVVVAQGPPGPPATPIDGGLGLLLADGVVYGIKKIRGNRKA